MKLTDVRERTRGASRSARGVGKMASLLDLLSGDVRWVEFTWSLPAYGRLFWVFQGWRVFTRLHRELRAGKFRAAEAKRSLEGGELIIHL